MNENQKVPKSLKAVAIVFIIGGVCAILEVIISLMNNRLNINFGVLGVFIGLGLFQLKPGWRICALVFIWIGLIAIPFFFLLSLLMPGPFNFTIFGQPVGHIPKIIGLLIAVGSFFLVFWQYQVLTRPDVRVLFQPERTNRV